MSLRKSIESGKEWRKERRRCHCLRCELNRANLALRRAKIEDSEEMDEAGPCAYRMRRNRGNKQALNHF